MSEARPIDGRYTQVVARQAFLSEAAEAEIAELLRCRLDAEHQYEQGRIGTGELESVRSRACEAEARLVAAHLRLVVQVARRFERDGVDLDDLVGVGNIALVMAARKYPESGRGRFAPYARNWVRGVVARAADQAGYPVKVPERRATQVRQYVSLQGSHRGRLDRATVRGFLGVGEGVLSELELLSFPAVSLSTPVGDGMSTLGDLIFYVDQELLEREETDRRLLPGEVNRLLAVLDREQKKVLQLLHGLGAGASGEPFTPAEIGERLELTEERVRQIQREARDRVLEAASKMGTSKLPKMLTARWYSRTASDIAVGAGD